MNPFRNTSRVLEQALNDRVSSAVAAEVGHASGRHWGFAAGQLAFLDGSPAVDADTLFDLASLTKVLSTATLALQLVSRGQLSLNARVQDVIPVWSSPDRAPVTIRDLLEHSAGLPAHRPYFKTLAGRSRFEEAIARETLEYTPRSRAVYSDLGFILLGFILEDIGGPLGRQFDDWCNSAGVDEALRYGVPMALRNQAAMTEQDTWRGRMLQGEVHDENAAALGGIAAHAGLFGTARSVGDAARWWLRLLVGVDDAATGVSSNLARSFITRSSVPASSRALGWDTMLPTSSCGTRLSAQAVGHTGFTGTSLWIDPTQDLYAVLLTNRVHPTRHDNDHIRAVRRAFHDAVIEDLTS